jgi:putative phosphoesterase
MKLGILADIHGNHFALREVLEEAAKQQVEKLLILGDIVGYYYHPDKVLELLDTWEYHFVKGNHEDLLQQVLTGELDIAILDAKYGSGHRAAIEKLTDTQVNKLLKAPEQVSLTIGGLKFFLCHGSPWDKNLYIYPDTDKSILDKVDETEADIVLIGHSHYAFLYKGNKTTLLNPGSVGQSRSTGGIANWAIIDTSNVVMQLCSTLYDTSDLINEVREKDPSNAHLANILSRNRK